MRSRPLSVEGFVVASFCYVLGPLYMGIYMFVHAYVVSRYFSHSNFGIISTEEEKAVCFVDFVYLKAKKKYM